MSEKTGPVWKQQFDTSFDFPRTPVAQMYVICTSPRCGSHHLGHLLHQSGGFGYPLEYMNSANLRIWARRARAAGAASPLAFIKSVRTDRNGVFGIKVHFEQLQTFVSHEPELLKYRFIVLTRQNLVKQAVSYEWAAQTKSWISGMPELGPATYDWSGISQKLAMIAKSNAGWMRFLNGLGITPLQLVHEQILRDPEGAIDQIACLLEIDRNHEAVGPRFIPREQGDHRKAEWESRFISETRERLSRGELGTFYRSSHQEPFSGIARFLRRTRVRLLSSD